MLRVVQVPAGQSVVPLHVGGREDLARRPPGRPGRARTARASSRRGRRAGPPRVSQSPSRNRYGAAWHERRSSRAVPRARGRGPSDGIVASIQAPRPRGRTSTRLRAFQVVHPRADHDPPAELIGGVHPRTPAGRGARGSPSPSRPGCGCSRRARPCAARAPRGPRGAACASGRPRRRRPARFHRSPPAGRTPATRPAFGQISVTSAPVRISAPTASRPTPARRPARRVRPRANTAAPPRPRRCRRSRSGTRRRTGRPRPTP